jgi:hypothetical protein
LGVLGIEELRNKVEWDFNMQMDLKDKLQESEEDRYTGKMNFDIQGWMFQFPRGKENTIAPPILDIGTTSLVSNELENRIDGLIDHAAPLISKHGSTYKNPREWATSHIRILKGFTTVHHNDKDFHFRISDRDYNDFNLNGTLTDYTSGT